MKVLKVNMVSEFCRVIKKYWYFMAINFAFFITTYFASKDINFGMDGKLSYTWTSNEGWIRLVNNSKVLTNEEKAELLKEAIL